MKIFRKWIRIGDLGICCPICGKPDWCRVSKNGEYVLCSRIPVYSQKGSLHKVDKSIETKGISDKANYYPPINWYALSKSYSRNCPLWRVAQYGALKRITFKSLIRLNMGFDGETYTFPIFNENYVITGVQRQFPDGIKSMVRGSKLGIFIPTSFDTEVGKLVITEGMSDTAVALDLGLNAIGRLNCSSGQEIIKNIVNKHKFDAYVVIDNDTNQAGYDGGMKLAKELSFLTKTVKIIIPPLKYNDLRGWVIKGGLSRKEFDEICKKLPIIK